MTYIEISIPCVPAILVSKNLNLFFFLENFTQELVLEASQ